MQIKETMKAVKKKRTSIFSFGLLGIDPCVDHPEFDRCRCSSCGIKLKVSDCPEELESEGWEYAPYIVHVCPNCNDGGMIDDYWPSKRSVIRWEVSRFCGRMKQRFEDWKKRKVKNKK